MNRRGMASTADAVVFLALMLLATATMYGIAGMADENAAAIEEMRWESDVARWTLDSLLGCTTPGGMPLLASLLEGETMDPVWLNGTMDVLVSSGGWSITWHGTEYGTSTDADRTSATAIIAGDTITLTLWY